jgi:probable F420-dependent oxidoreductase
VQAIVKRVTSVIRDNGGVIRHLLGGTCPMRLGVSLAQVGRLADPASVRAAAVSAEQIGYSSLWVRDRLLAPVEPRTTNTNLPGAELPPEWATSLDPLAVLTYAAAVTDRVRLGTSILVAPWYRPALLARSLASLDVLSDGRLTVGLGLGWSLDEYEAAGVPLNERGSRLDHALDVLEACWAPDPICYDGPDLRIAPSLMGPKPLQHPRPPILLAGYSPAGLDRVARRADGWNPVGLPVERLASMWTTVRHLAAGYGRDPDGLHFVVRANMLVTPDPLRADRPSYHGSIDQVADDVEATRRAGADEIVLGLFGDHSLNEALEHYACVAEAAELVPLA